MKDLVESISLSILSNGLRSFLSVLGVVIAVASLIAIMSLMESLRLSIGSQFEQLGSNSLSITSYTSIDDTFKGVESRITPDDYRAIVDRIAGIDSITPIMLSSSEALNTVSFRQQSSVTEVRGTTSSYPKVANLYAARGRFLRESDSAERRRVCVVGTTLAKELGITGSPVGEFIFIGQEWFKVVGVMEERGSFFGFSQDNYVLVPYETLVTIQGETNPDLFIQLNIGRNIEIASVKEALRALLRNQHALEVGTPDDFMIETPEQVTQVFEETIDIISFVMFGIIAIAMVVGGIGIMNIMLVSVTERTKEIGIYKALGASRGDILIQFLSEATALSTIGGVLGVVFGFLFAAAISSIIPNIYFSPAPVTQVVGVVLLCGVLGVCFGIIPASKAADLDPIEALRYE